MDYALGLNDRFEFDIIEYQQESVVFLQILVLFMEIGYPYSFQIQRVWVSNEECNHCPSRKGVHRPNDERGAGQACE